MLHTILKDIGQEDHGISFYFVKTQLKSLALNLPTEADLVSAHQFESNLYIYIMIMCEVSS